jgi:hypothetical protein
MFILSAIAVFFLTILLEILIVLDYYATIQGQAVRSAILTGLCTIIGGMIILIYVQSKIMLAVDATGASVGAYIAVRFGKGFAKLAQATSVPIDTEQ